jgi:hypothetical protein
MIAVMGEAIQVHPQAKARLSSQSVGDVCQLS